MTNTLRIESKGESIKQLLATRLKEFDRNIERVNQALLSATAEFDRAGAETARNMEEAVVRAQRGNGGLGRRDNETVGFSDVFAAKQQIEKLQNGIDYLRYQRSQVLWLAEQFKPDQLYTLDVNDLDTLGIGIGKQGRYGVFDPLDM